jgi:hypothetical protein
VNVVQLSRALGHHSASFTLDTYVHMLPGEGAPPLDLDDALVDADPGQLPGNTPQVVEANGGEAILREVAA